MTLNFLSDKINFVRKYGMVFIMEKNIKTNKNQNDGLIFSKTGKLMDGSITANSQCYIRIKRSDLDFIDNKQYYALYKQSEKDGDFVLDGTFDPVIPQESTTNKEKGKNFFETMCSYNENVFGLRFCFANRELEQSEARDVSLDNPDLIWLELKIDSNGDEFLARYNPQNKTWKPTEISFALKDLFGGNDTERSGTNSIWEMYPKKKYGDGKFLTTFATQDCIDIRTNENPDNPLEEMKKIVKNDTGLSIDNGEMNIYTCMQFEFNGEFYLDWGPEDTTAREAFNKVLGTINNHNKKMEAVLALRFYVTPEKLNINVGQKFDEIKISNPATCSVFEIRRDANNNMVMWHFDRDNNAWIPVDATVVHKVEYKQNVKLINTDLGPQIILETKCKDTHEYKCKLNLNSYSVESLWEYGRKPKSQKQRIDTCNLSPFTIKTSLPFNFGLLKRLKKWCISNKSKIIFSVIVGFLSAIWIGWFAVPSAIILFLISFVIDKLVKCPSIEKWFKNKKRAYGLPPILSQRLQRIQRNEVQGDVVNGLNGRGPFAIPEQEPEPEPERQQEPEQQGIVLDD